MQGIIVSISLCFCVFLILIYLERQHFIREMLQILHVDHIDYLKADPKRKKELIKEKYLEEVYLLVLKIQSFIANEPIEQDRKRALREVVAVMFDNSDDIKIAVDKECMLHIATADQSHVVEKVPMTTLSRIIKLERVRLFLGY